MSIHELTYCNECRFYNFRPDPTDDRAPTLFDDRYVEMPRNEQALPLTSIIKACKHPEMTQSLNGTITFSYEAATMTISICGIDVHLHLCKAKKK
jgi:hypothetical protein